MALDILACGHLAAQWLIPLDLLRKAANDTAIQPAARINNVDYFSSGDAVRLEKRVRELQQAQAGAAPRGG